MQKPFQRARELHRLQHTCYRAAAMQDAANAGENWKDFNVFLYTYLKHTRLYPTQADIRAIAIDALNANGVQLSHALVDSEFRKLEQLMEVYREKYLRSEVEAYWKSQASSSDIAAWQAAASSVCKTTAAHASSEGEADGMMPIFSRNTERIRLLRERLYNYLKYHHLHPSESQRAAIASQWKLQARHGTSLATVRELVNREVCAMHKRELRKEVSAYESAGPLHGQQASRNVDPTAGLIDSVPPSAAAPGSCAGPSDLANQMQDVTTDSIRAAVLSSMAPPPAAPLAPTLPAADDVLDFFNDDVPDEFDSDDLGRTKSNLS